MSKSYYELIRESNKSYDFNKGWIKFDGFLNRDMADFLYGYVLLSKRRLEVFEKENDLSEIAFPTYKIYKILSIHQNMYGKHMYGTFNDSQALGDYSKYGDLVFDTLLIGKTKQLSEITQINLVPQYSYHRLYTKGTELERHRDRESCEISVTLCLGYESHYNWPIWFEEKSGEKISVTLNPGDMVIYKGVELDHWREPFQGKNHAQVFLHYNDKNGPYGHQKFDGREVLGVPK